MAVTPLFSTRDSLLNKARMSTAKDVQTLALVDMAITEVRLEFFAAISSERAIQIAGYNTVDNPTSTEEVIKAIAATAEILWVTAKLVEQLPVMFLQDLNKVRDDFNDEPLTRDAAGLARYKNSIMSRVEKLIGKLKSPAEVAGNFQVVSCGAVDADGNDSPYILADRFIGNKVLNRGF